MTQLPNIRVPPLDGQGYFTRDWYIAFSALFAATSSRLTAYTVATLPVGTQGDRAFVIDALAPSFLAPVASGGSVVSPVFFNGSVWVTA